MINVCSTDSRPEHRTAVRRSVPGVLGRKHSRSEKQLKPGQGAAVQRFEKFECCEVANGCVTNDVGFTQWLDPGL